MCALTGPVLGSGAGGRARRRQWQSSARTNSGGSVEWEVDGAVESEDFSDSWSKEIEIPSGSWPRLVVTGNTDDSDLALKCSIKLDDEVVFEHSGTDSTKTASCSVFV